MSENIGKKIEDAFDNISEIAVPVIVAGAIIGGAGVRAYENISDLKYQKKICTSIEQNNNTNNNMLKSAFKNKLETFKKSIDEGADIKTTNQYGQDALMVAIQGKSYDVASYILNTPELASKIDYNRCDINGNNLTSIIESEIAEKTSPQLQEIIKSVNKNRGKQTNEETQGKTRSDTCWDMMSMVDRNMLEK